MILLIQKVLIATITFLVLDGLWLDVIAKSLYQNNLKSFLTISNGQLSFNWLSAIIVYIFLITAILAFPVAKANNNCKLAIFWGFVFGLAVYGTYGFTNHALVKNWPLKISLIDTFWGGVLCGLTALATVYFTLNK